ncbi:ATPase [Prevotella herbatica]|uniref:ATPase n=1 Tax=Prevotella herbatica TaxID=2801997 RepID=A0ABM7P0E9_9BACT|nr:ATPase [Prevotella herbatica]BCS86189.1 ATPase [Prevotella herbatica]
MLIIADSGSTKTDWFVVKNNEITRTFRSQGINPFHQKVNEIKYTLKEEVLCMMSEEFLSSDLNIAFYGSGCTVEKIPVMQTILGEVFSLPLQNVEVAGDLLGAARAVCGHESGIACILGTGANSCLYDGKEITANTPPLGYILGDEGSGAVLGKRFMNGIFKGWIPERIKDMYLKETNQTYSSIISKVYTEPLANRYLATVSKFVGEHIDEEPLRKLVKDNFSDFMKYNILPYGEVSKIGFIGSVADVFSDILKEVCKEYGFVVSRINQSPVAGLLDYYRK